LLTEDARRRLKAIETFADLGSGFNIAMQDLDIRGAGNMLGAEQSGFITDLGYETYQKILNEAVLELKDEEFADLYADSRKEDENFVSDCTIDTDLDVGFPETYIESSAERISLYRELDSLTNEEQLADYQNRLIDRFGTIPDKAMQLFSALRLRWMALKLGVESIVLKNNRLTLFLVGAENVAYYQSETFGRVILYATNHPRRCELREKDGRRSIVVLNVKNLDTAQAVVSEMM
jgi:transcription-repair coupling factor (superfamily II helicase)